MNNDVAGILFLTDARYINSDFKRLLKQIIELATSPTITVLFGEVTNEVEEDIRKNKFGLSSYLLMDLSTVTRKKYEEPPDIDTNINMIKRSTI